MEKKYIVKLDDNKLAYTAIIIDGVPYIKPLQLLPYTEPDLEQVRKEAYEEGYAEGSKEDYDEAYLKGYNQGLADAWDAARKICHMDSMTRDEVFGLVITSNIFDENTASEAIEKIRQYEQEKEEIKVGDEVKSIESDWTAIVTKSEEGHLTLMGDSGAIANGYDAKYFAKTGRHFPEIAEALQKMREE